MGRYLFLTLFYFSSGFAMSTLEGTYLLEDSSDRECYEVFEIYASKTSEVFYSIIGDEQLIASIDQCEINAGSIDYKDDSRTGKFSATFDSEGNILIYEGRGRRGVLPYRFHYKLRKVGLDGLHLTMKSFHHEKPLWFGMSCRYFMVE